MIQLGEQLENPYSVTNMQKAYQSLRAANPNSKLEDVTIDASHIYIRFRPQDETELDILNSDSTLVLYSYPLDHEIPEGGDHYHDPEVPEGQPTYQYCAIPKDKPLPKGVAFEVLEELFIPEELDDVPNERMLPDVYLDALVDEALRLTGNLEVEDKFGNPEVQRKKWHPAGRIAIFDGDLGGYVGVHGVEVRARRWFTTHKGYTASNGYFSCDGTFKRDANYSFKWDRYDFEIRNGDNGPGSDLAEVNGPKITGGWNLNISSTSNHWLYALIFQASHDYYYGNRLGLKSPPTNSFWKPKVKISAYNYRNDEANGRHCKDCRFLGIGSRIKIWENTNESSGIYATTLHELAHASHWELRKNDWLATEDKVQESWARGVQRELARLRYKNYEPIYSRLQYTGLVPDLIDGEKWSVSYCYWTSKTSWNESYKEYRDQVTGYSIKEIEDVMENTSTWGVWKKNLKNNYTNETEIYLDSSFDYWVSK
ncbi:hypothetical protein DN752_09820 [Echinicola strongylocentroti]|uniref:Uncharacterized protein n=1 Tax=Echinicola strongylocentroti TaxID=1795355 RepID=A0A2Z4IHE3_9BACT|nr:hypothetical protein [Echinicola strongylocentroti]AWW30394.1 hypothetical protein DN752_09820 [Echinicola strongylocentroti]